MFNIEFVPSILLSESTDGLIRLVQRGDEFDVIIEDENEVSYFTYDNYFDAKIAFESYL